MDGRRDCEKSREIYELYRFRIQNENELVHNRMSWFIPLQSFLFISFAIFSNGDLVELIGFWFVVGISSVGVLSAIVTLVSVRSAIGAMREIEEAWLNTETYTNEGKFFPPLMGGTRKVAKEGTQADEIRLRSISKRITGTVITYMLPCVAICFWVGMLALALLLPSFPNISAVSIR